MAFPVDHGTIDFKMHRSDTASEFIRCRPNVDKRLIVNHAFDEWKLKAPGVLMRVTGSSTVDPMESSPIEWQEKFDEAITGVLQAASTASGWLFSTGLDFGMGNALGMAVGRARQNCDCPLIGFAEWLAVQGLDQLQKDGKGRPAEPGAKRPYTDCAPDEDMSTVSLQAYHTHFVLVGGPKSEMSEEEWKATERRTSTVALQDDDVIADKENDLLEARKRSYKFAHAFEKEVNLAVQEQGESSVPRVLVVIAGDATTITSTFAPFTIIAIVL